MPRGRMISASEIGEYVFCRRAWWLHQVLDVEPTGKARRERGVADHKRHGRQVQASQLLLGLGMLLALLSLLVLLVF